MEAFGVKALIYLISVLVTIPLAFYSLLTKGHDSDVWEWIHEHRLDSVFDSMSIGFVSAISALKLNGVEIEFHGLFQNVCYYLGGAGSLVWVFLRIKLAILEGQNKRLDNKLKEQQLRHNTEEKKRNELIVKEVLRDKGLENI